jgi:hypothetical protein
MMELERKLIAAAAFLLLSATVAAADYVRPPPRKTLHLASHPKTSSQPQQVTELLESWFDFDLLMTVLVVYYLVFEL